ncbi:MAG: PaaI family thioesterase [Kofleriaceae bacterium]|nr:PaaI family thioesterase [Kofleriaceae bacterium]MCB9574429.1 PaaI family thioesterase [Kofleriaceae bacterium]
MDEPFGDQHKDALRRLASSLRSLVESSVALTAPLAELEALAADADALRARAAAHAGQRPFPAYAAPVDGDLATILPWGVISGPYNPIAAPVIMHIDDGKAYGTVTFGLPYEGPPGGVHGGVVAMVFDQILAFAAVAAGIPGHTRSLTTAYRRITPLHTELRFAAWVERTEDRKVFVRGDCHAGDTLVSEADAVFIRFRDDDARAFAT